MPADQPDTAGRPVTSSPAGHVHFEDDPDTCTMLCDEDQPHSSDGVVP